MPSFLSFSVQALVLSLLCPAVLSRENQPRAKRLEEIIERGQDVDKRGVCYGDDTYESFKYWIADSAGFCSTLLGIVDFTRTVPQISRTTTTTVSTTFSTVTATTTVAAVTVFSTHFVPVKAKRQDPVPTSAPDFYQENPYAYGVLVDNVNASIAASYYSACSCLSLRPSTVDALTTRTISGKDSEESTVFVYVTTGTTTSVLTRAGNPFGSSTLTSTISVIPTPVPTSITSVAPPLSTGVTVVSTPKPTVNSSIPYPISNSTTRIPSVTGVSSGLPSTPSTNLTTSLRPTSGLPIPSGNGSIISRPTSGFPTPSGNSSVTLSQTSGFPISYTNITSGFPTPSANGTITSRATSGFPTPSANGSFTSRPTSGFPVPSVNSSVISRPTSGFPVLPTNITSGLPTQSQNYSFTLQPTSASPIPSPNLTLTSPLTSALPTPPANLSSYISTSVSAATFTYTYPAPLGSVSVSYFTGEQTLTNTYPVPPESLSISYFTGVQTFTVTPSPASASTSSSALSAASSTTSTAATAAPSSLDIAKCPGLNGTIVTLPDGQEFAVVCETEYGGPVDIGLTEATFGSCVLDCGNANNGFSAVRCRGVTYFPNNIGQNCFWKNLAALSDFDMNDGAVSAVLINAPLLSTTIPVPTAFPTPTG
ncbi:MAG: hypothetical protein Q9218_001392 [Villophora microphyllina]